MCAVCRNSYGAGALDEDIIPEAKPEIGDGNFGGGEAGLHARHGRLVGRIQRHARNRAARTPGKTRAMCAPTTCSAPKGGGGDARAGAKRCAGSRLRPRLVAKPFANTSPNVLNGCQKPAARLSPKWLRRTSATGPRQPHGCHGAPAAWSASCTGSMVRRRVKCNCKRACGEPVALVSSTPRLPAAAPSARVRRRRYRAHPNAQRRGRPGSSAPPRTVPG